MIENNYEERILKEFLKELTELSDNYNLYIGGCGCCGSPHIYRKETKYLYNDLEFLENKYTVTELEN